MFFFNVFAFRKYFVLTRVGQFKPLQGSPSSDIGYGTATLQDLTACQQATWTVESLRRRPALESKEVVHENLCHGLSKSTEYTGLVKKNNFGKTMVLSYFQKFTKIR